MITDPSARAMVAPDPWDQEFKVPKHCACGREINQRRLRCVGSEMQPQHCPLDPLPGFDWIAYAKAFPGMVHKGRAQ